MHIGSRTYLQVVSLFRSLRAQLASGHDTRAQEASPVLILVAVTLALLLVILEVDLHRAEFQVLGLLGNLNGVDPALLAP
jgi:hypothetical protein